MREFVSFLLGVVIGSVAVAALIAAAIAGSLR